MNIFKTNILFRENGKDPRFKALEKSRDREDIFKDFLVSKSYKSTTQINTCFFV